jgi:hypothetical protein
VVTADTDAAVQRAVERIQKIEKNYLISKTTLQI